MSLLRRIEGARPGQPEQPQQPGTPAQPPKPPAEGPLSQSASPARDAQRDVRSRLQSRIINNLDPRLDLSDAKAVKSSIEEMFNIFPFDNTITKMELSGYELRLMFDYIARRSAARSCDSQAQIAGSRIRINCSGCTRPEYVNHPCHQDADCPSGVQGGCDLETNICLITACADQVFVGDLYDANGLRKALQVDRSARRVGQEQNTGAEEGRGFDGQRDGPPGMALVVVQPALEDQHAAGGVGASFQRPAADDDARRRGQRSVRRLRGTAAERCRESECAGRASRSNGMSHMGW